MELPHQSRLTTSSILRSFGMEHPAGTWKLTILMKQDRLAAAMATMCKVLIRASHPRYSMLVSFDLTHRRSRAITIRSTRCQERRLRVRISVHARLTIPETLWDWCGLIIDIAPQCGCTTPMTATP